jgi:hypothetical protein
VLKKYGEDFEGVKPAFKNDAADAYVLGKMAVEWHTWKRLNYKNNPPCEYQYQADCLKAIHQKFLG